MQGAALHPEGDGHPLHPCSANTLPWILALNNQFAAELSWLDAERLASLLSRAFYARQIGDALGFILAFDEQADYDSPNFQWFCARYPRFIYIDRVAVAVSARGKGFARRLYQGVIGHAAKAGHDVIVCEVNAIPPNPLSDAFHAAMGFSEVGMASVYGGTKTVRYLALPVAAACQ